MLRRCADDRPAARGQIAASSPLHAHMSPSMLPKSDRHPGGGLIPQTQLCRRTGPDTFNARCWCRRREHGWCGWVRLLVWVRAVASGGRHECAASCDGGCLYCNVRFGFGVTYRAGAGAHANNMTSYARVPERGMRQRGQRIGCSHTRTRAANISHL